MPDSEKPEAKIPPASVKKSVRALRLLFEGVAIIISILLAFSIDAWWDGRKEQAASAVAVSGLLDEFRDNLRQLRVEKNMHADALKGAEALLRLMGPEPSPLPDVSVIAPLLVSCLTNANFEPRLGTLNSLIASGNLQLIEDQELRGALTEWPSSAGDLIGWEQIERENTEQYLLRFTFDYVALPDIMVALAQSETKAAAADSLSNKVAMRFQPSAFESDFPGLFSSLRFEGMLTSRAVNLKELIERMNDLERQTVEIIEGLSR